MTNTVPESNSNDNIEPNRHQIVKKALEQADDVEDANQAAFSNVVYGGRTSLKDVSDRCHNQAALNNIVHGTSASAKAVSDGRHIVKWCTPTYNTVKQVKDYRNHLHAECSFTVGDDYLAGKVLIESGSKVAFDGNPRDYIASRKRVGHILSIYGPQHGLIYDVLHSGV